MKIHICKVYFCDWCRVANCPGLGLRDFTGKTRVNLAKLGWLVTLVAEYVVFVPDTKVFLYIMTFNIYSYTIV